MSPVNAPGPMVVRASNNVYTALAFISFAATLGALVFVILRFRELGIL
jgi:hypothetical protein